MKTRLAPTPSGYLHLGNVVNFLLTDSLVKTHSGKLVLRIDDFDRARFRNEYLEDIFRVIEALGIQIDEGPSDVKDFEKNYSQKFRGDRYKKLLDALQDHVFVCECSRNDVLAISESTTYMGTCLKKDLVDSEACKLRLNFTSNRECRLRDLNYKSNVHSLTEPYPIVRRRGRVAGYHVVSVCEDVDSGIDFWVRGEDLFQSSLIQSELMKLSGHKEEADRLQSYHHPLLLKDNVKLSKSQIRSGHSLLAIYSKAELLRYGHTYCNSFVRNKYVRTFIC